MNSKIQDKTEEIIKVSKLSKQYGKFKAVDNISFSVYQNEIFGLLGPNGAGKTTTFEIMETLREKSSGQITIGGYDIDSEQNFIKSIIGVQLQASGFPAMLTLKEILNQFAALYNVKVNPMELLDKVQLCDKANNKVKQLSGGQRQRFSIATTLVHQPPIIFLDEPSTGLDPQARHNLWELIRQIRDGGTTVMMTTHFMDEAEELCDRVAIMDEGKIIKLGNPDELIEELTNSGFVNKRVIKKASLEDLFITLTGKNIRE